jgi:hypothetical protein
MLNLRQNVAMDETQLLSEAEFAWDDGRTMEAVQLMKLAVKRDPSLLTVRRVLAERYRELGKPDQAGRWGIVFEGWTTDVERDRLARLLASSGVAHGHVVEFLSLPRRGVLPQDIVDLLSGPVERYRHKFDVPVMGTDLDGVGCLLFGLWGATTVVSLGRFFDGLEATRSPTEQIAGAVWIVCVTSVMMLCATHAARLGQVRSVLVWTLLALVTAALLVPRVAAYWPFG